MRLGRRKDGWLGIIRREGEGKKEKKRDIRVDEYSTMKEKRYK